MSEVIKMTNRNWIADENAVATLSEIMAKLPELQASGVITSFVATNHMINIQLANPKKQGWLKRHFKED